VNLEATTMMTCPCSLCQLQSILADPRPSIRKIQLTRPRQSPNFAHVPSRVAEGLAQRCHGNRFRQVRDDQVPIPGPRPLGQRWRDRGLMNSRDSWWA
jgi:hypothetical protein